MSTPLPFDSLRPFKSTPEAFTPRDNIPWEALAEQLLRCLDTEGFIGLRPLQTIEAHVASLVKHWALPQKATILDFGCGPGLYSNRLAGHGYQVTGIDIAQPLLDYAQTEAQAQRLECTYRRLSLFDLAFEAEFDAALLINSIVKCLSLAELGSILTKAYTALKPGAQLMCEFAVQPANFTSAEPTITESISFLAQSPWSNQFHAWMIRDLTFPAVSERVTHHLILPPNGQPAEYWSRFILHSLPDLIDRLTSCGFQIQAIFDETLNQPYQQTAAETCFISVQRKD